MSSASILKETGRKIKCETIDSSFYKGLKIEDEHGTFFFLNRDVVSKSWNLDLPLFYLVEKGSMDLVKEHINNWSNNLYAPHTITFKEIRTLKDIEGTLYQFINSEAKDEEGMLINLNLKYYGMTEVHYTEFLDVLDVLSDIETYLCYIDICVAPNMKSFL